MNRFHSLIFAAAASIVVLWATPSAEASLLRFGFSGQIQATIQDDGSTPTTSYAGHFIIDTSTADSDADPNAGRYFNAVTDGTLVIGDDTYEYSSPLFRDVFVFNDADTVNDLFFALLDMVDADGNTVTAAIQLGDASQAALDSDAIPDTLALNEFDPFVIGNANSTGGFFIFEPAARSVQGTVESISLTAVPLPGAGLLFGSALMIWGALRR